MIPNAYRVSNWNALYENNRTRELKRLDWVPVPNAMDGAGYTELVDHPNGAAHFGAWIAILEIASRQPVRGEIPQATAGTSQALARISRLPSALFDDVLPRLISLGWVEATRNQQLAEIPHGDAEISHPTAEIPALKGIEENRREGEGASKKRQRQKHTADSPSKSRFNLEFLPDEWRDWVKGKYGWQDNRALLAFDRFSFYWLDKTEERPGWLRSWQRWCADDEAKLPTPKRDSPSTMPPRRASVFDLTPEQHAAKEAEEMAALTKRFGLKLQ